MKHKQTKEQLALAESMRLALLNEHNGYVIPEPKIVSAFNKETLRFLSLDNPLG
jgi:hypothetical protein